MVHYSTYCDNSNYIHYVIGIKSTVFIIYSNVLFIPILKHCLTPHVE